MPVSPPTASRSIGGSRPGGCLTAWAVHRAIARVWWTCRRPHMSLNPLGPDGTPQPPDSSAPVVEAGATVLVEIPADFLALKAADPVLALRWRLGTRAAFQTLFRQGYGVTDFLHKASATPRAVLCADPNIIHSAGPPHDYRPCHPPPLSMPLVAPFETSFGITTERECILVSIQSEGLTGWGECAVDRDPGYSYETTGTAWHILKDFIVPSAAGRVRGRAADFQQQVAGIRGHNLAKAGVEMALWESARQAPGKPAGAAWAACWRVVRWVSRSACRTVPRRWSRGSGNTWRRVWAHQDQDQTRAGRRRRRGRPQGLPHIPLPGGCQLGLHAGDQPGLAAAGPV